MEKKRDAAVGIIRQEDRVLLLKRRKDDRSYPGLWCLPGGKVEEGESVTQGLVREVFEETNLQVTDFKALDYVVSINFIMHFFEVEVASLYHLLLSDEHVSYKWADKEEILLMDDLAGNTKSFLTKYLK